MLEVKVDRLTARRPQGPLRSIRSARRSNSIEYLIFILSYPIFFCFFGSTERWIKVAGWEVFCLLLPPLCQHTQHTLIHVHSMWSQVSIPIPLTLFNRTQLNSIGTFSEVEGRNTSNVSLTFCMFSVILCLFLLNLFSLYLWHSHTQSVSEKKRIMLGASQDAINEFHWSKKNQRSLVLPLCDKPLCRIQKRDSTLKDFVSLRMCRACMQSWAALLSIRCRALGSNDDTQQTAVY